MLRDAALETHLAQFVWLSSGWPHDRSFAFSRVWHCRKWSIRIAWLRAIRQNVSIFEIARNLSQLTASSRFLHSRCHEHAADEALQRRPPAGSRPDRSAFARHLPAPCRDLSRHRRARRLAHHLAHPADQSVAGLGPQCHDRIWRMRASSIRRIRSPAACRPTAACASSSIRFSKSARSHADERARIDAQIAGLRPPAPRRGCLVRRRRRCSPVSRIAPASS